MDLLVIAEVLKPQGIRGEIKMKTFTDYPEDVKAFKTLFIDGKPYKILSFRSGENDVAYAHLAGVFDRNAAELLRGKQICGNRADAPKLEDGQYYIVDIIGLACVDETGKKLGVVTDVTQIASEIYTIQTEDGKQILFPVVDGVVQKVDVEGGVIVVNGKRFLEVSVVN